MQKYRFQCEFEGKCLENNFGPSVKRSDKKNQNGRQKSNLATNFQLFVAYNNFCIIEHKIVILVSRPTYVCMSN